MPHKDPEERQAYLKAYREKNKTRIAAKKLHDNHVNPEPNRARQRRYRERHRERIAVRQRDWQQAHRHQRREYYLKNRERLLEKERVYRLVNKRLIQERKRLDRLAHPHKYREKDRRYYQRNSPKRKAYVREYQRTHPHMTTAYSQRKRAAKAQNGLNDFTGVQWQEMQESYGHRCVYCQRRFKGTLTMDHLIPLSKGGAHTAANIVPACRSCNSKKRTGPPLTPVQPVLLLVAPARKKR